MVEDYQFNKFFTYLQNEMFIPKVCYLFILKLGLILIIFQFLEIIGPLIYFLHFHKAICLNCKFLRRVPSSLSKSGALEHLENWNQMSVKGLFSLFSTNTKARF